MEILYSIFVALCLSIGFYFGFKIGKTNELPKIRNKAERQKAEEETKLIDDFNRDLERLNKYDGSSKGQEDIV